MTDSSENSVPRRRLVVGVTGATGTAYAVRLLAELRAAGWESHLVVSEAGGLTARHELGLGRRDLEAKADFVYGPREMGAAIASGSFLTDGMVIAPCSMKTLAAVAHAYSHDLIIRAADVTLKERRRLVILPREAPFNLAHLRNMVAVTEMGAVVFPPVPALYAKPATIDDLVGYTVARVLDLFGLHAGNLARWQGIRPAEED